MALSRRLVALMACIAAMACQSTTKRSEVQLVGGRVAMEGQYASVIQLNRTFPEFTNCSASRISQTHVLLAAHCVLFVMDGLQSKYGTLFYSHGVHPKKVYSADIKAVYAPQKAIDFLWEHGTFNSPELEVSGIPDVTVIELAGPINDVVSIATLSDRVVQIGTRFRYGGYGCETHPSIETDPSVTQDLPSHPRLKYAQGRVTKVAETFARGQTFEDKTMQSSCPGDSGGPVFIDTLPEDPAAPLNEVIGVNSFHHSKSTGDDINSENNFVIVTKNSKSGQWIQEVLAGKITPLRL